MSDNRFSCKEVLSEMAKQESRSKNWLANLLIVFISLFIFFRVGLLKVKVDDVLVVILVLFVHEGGHYLGMRLFGYRNVQMFFLPFFGAAVSGESLNSPAYKKAIVSLLGPVPGMLLGIVFLILYTKTEAPIYLKLTIMFLMINAFNLLPFLPLDGGRFLHEVLFSRNRYIELCFRVLASLSLITVAYFLEAWLLALLGVLNLAFVRFPFKFATIAKDVKRDLLSGGTPDLDTVRTENADCRTVPSEIAEEIIPRIYEHCASRLDLKTVARYTSEIWKRICVRAPGPLATVALLGLYVLCFCLPLGAVLSVAVLSQFEQNPLNKKRIVEYQKPNGDTGLKQQIYFLGKLSSEIEVDPNSGLYHGRGLSYYPDGTISTEGAWWQGRWDAEWKEYGTEGTLIRVTVFARGKFISRRELQRGHWVEKSWEDLPVWLKHAIVKHNERPPLGANLVSTVSEKGE